MSLPFFLSLVCIDPLPSCSLPWYSVDPDRATVGNKAYDSLSLALAERSPLSPRVGRSHLADRANTRYTERPSPYRAVDLFISKRIASIRLRYPFTIYLMMQIKT